MSKKQFKSESKKLLDMMINSIYTHKEIFLRELISNASDAIDKLYYISLSDENISFNREDFYIRITADKESRTLTITDTGIGMTKEELEDNLGTIAKSGSLAFKSENEAKEDVDIIGQFGVGFYSAFMVADKVTVTTKRFRTDEAFVWESEGADGYTVNEASKDTAGTEIVLKIKENTDEENYDEFLEQYKLKGIVKKYSDYIRYPIKMMISKSRPKEDNKEEYETYFEDETLNSMVPLWKKNKNELKDEDYNNFYKEKFFDFSDPAKVIHTSADGSVSYNALMFVPSRTPYDFYTKEYEKGLQLYSNGVLIMEKCGDLLPDYFSFIKGLVDTPDLSLNISRELLQHDRQLKLIAQRIEKKLKSEFLSMIKNDREKYNEFFAQFGRHLKYGIYADFGQHKEVLEDLIMFYSSKEKAMSTLEEYVGRMLPDQKVIYYACGENVDRIAKLPQVEAVADKGYEILYFTEDVDEFAIKMMMKYKDFDFKSVSSDDLDLKTDEEKKQEEELKEESKDLLEFLKESLGDKAKEVIISKRLKSHPVCITNAGEISIEMEKVLKASPEGNNFKAERILEINPDHAVFATIKKLFETDKEKLKKYTSVLYNSALLIEGLSVEDPVEFSNNICELI